MVRRWLSTAHSGVNELVALTALYGLYEVVRGFGGENLAGALGNTDDIVALERHLGVFVERSVQQSVDGVSLLPALLGIAYIALHFVGTAVAVVWVHRRHPSAYPMVRTTIVASTALALVGYLAYPAAPPRLADLGFADTVTEHTGLNLSSDLLGSFYNPIAAVPSLHFGYALIVGVAVAALAGRPAIRIAGALYPAVMLFVIVATGNHFLFDAAAGAFTVGVAAAAARWLTSARHEPMSRSRRATLGVARSG
jgi:PAP2 superfamily protein